MLGRAACLVLIAGGMARGQVLYTYTGTPVAIPDSPTGQCGPEAVAEIAVGTEYQVDAVKVGFYIPHPFQGDVKVQLTHVETGTTVTLVNRPGAPETLIGFASPAFGSPTALMRLTDSAALPYELPAVPAPGVPNVSGDWKPASPLSAFRGESSLGTWQLRVQDCAGVDTGQLVSFSLWLTPVCYANCDQSTISPVLNIFDFTCFLQAFANGCGSPSCYANCDGSTQAPILSVADMTCFLVKYAAGCPAP